MLARYPPWYQGCGGHDALGGLEDDRLCDGHAIPGFVEIVRGLLPSLTDTPREGREILLCTKAHLVRPSLPDTQELGEIRLGEKLAPRIFQIELPALSRSEIGASIGILTACPFVEPLALSKGAIRRRRMKAAGKTFDADVERMIGKEVGGTDPILAVGILRDSRHQLRCPFGRHDGKLHLHECPGEIELAEFRDMNGGGRLSAVHDLEVPETTEQQLPSFVRDIDLLGRGGDAVVVGEEHRRLVLERDPDAAVDLPARLEKYPARSARGDAVPIGRRSGRGPVRE